MSAVTFPQPEVQAPAHNTAYFYLSTVGKIVRDNYISWPNDKIRLANGSVYLTEDEAEQRKKWDAQETARLVIPAWFRSLGDDVQYLLGKEWARFAPESAKFVHDWSKEKPESYRAKPAPKAAPDVVKILDGVEYRWPATAKESDPIGKRFVARLNKVTFRKLSKMWGNRSHFTRAGAEAQNAMFAAALGAL